MGNYIFSTHALIESLARTPRTPTRATTWAATSSRASSTGATRRSTTSRRNDVPGSTDRDKAYWRDVGTIDAYHEAHLDLISVDPIFNLYNSGWPIWTYPVQMPAAKFTLRGLALDSLVSPGCIISGGSIESSVLSPNVRVDEGSKVDHSVLLTGARVGHKAIVRNAILDKNVVVKDGAKVGVSQADDLARGYTVSDNGITVVGKGVVVK